MMRITITHDSDKAHDFLVHLSGVIKRPKALNDALGRRLARVLQAHFRIKNTVPNSLRGKRTNFWNAIAKTTAMTEATDKGATVTIAENRFNIHFYGGTIKPTGGRKALTIPLIPGAHGQRARDYEKNTGKKLFRIGNALFERSSSGDRSLTGATRVSARTASGQTRSLNLRGRSRIRAVYALAKSVTIKADPKALPDAEIILHALNQTAEQWLDREMKKRGGKS